LILVAEGGIEPPTQGFSVPALVFCMPLMILENRPIKSRIFKALTP